MWWGANEADAHQEKGGQLRQLVHFQYVIVESYRQEIRKDAVSNGSSTTRAS